MLCLPGTRAGTGCRVASKCFGAGAGHCVEGWGLGFRAGPGGLSAGFRIQVESFGIKSLGV